MPSSQRDALEPCFSIATRIVSSQNRNQTGPQPFMSDVSAADPASIGVCILIANWTNAGNLDYGAAATSQIEYLFTAVPKTPDGAISHRVAQVQLWFVSIWIFYFPTISHKSFQQTIGAILYTWFRLFWLTTV